MRATFLAGILSMGCVLMSCHDASNVRPDHPIGPVTLQASPGWQILELGPEASAVVNGWFQEAEIVRVFKPDPEVHTDSIPFGYILVGDATYCVHTSTSAEFEYTDGKSVIVLSHPKFPMLLRVMQMIPSPPSDHSEDYAVSQELRDALQEIRLLGSQ